MTDASHFDCPWWKATNLWSSFDAHFHHGAGSVSQYLSPIKTANTSIMYTNDEIAFELPDLQVQHPLTLCWCSVPEWGREHVALSVDYQARQYRT